MPTTPNLQLELHTQGEQNWDVRVNGNLSVLDTRLQALKATNSGLLVCVDGAGNLIPLTLGFGLALDTTDPNAPILTSMTTLKLAAIRLLGKGSAPTLKGIYIDNLGRQLGASWTLAVPQANGANQPVGFPSIPSGAADALFKGDSAATVYVGAAENDAAELADMVANAANYPEMELLTDAQSARGLVG